MPGQFKRAVYLVYASAFLFFLLYTAPHRVHHFFDQQRQADHSYAAGGQQHHDRQIPPRSNSNCAFQAAANTCHLGPTDLVQFFSSPVLLAGLPVERHLDIPQRYLAYPFQVRAPPEA